MDAAVGNAVLNELSRRTRLLQPWAPSDLRTGRGREKRLMQRMEEFMRELGSSRFYRHFRHLLRISSISEHLRKVLGGHSKMNMVIYGIGSFESGKKSAMQLSLAILMQRDFKWVGNIQVFDPVLSVTECRILEALGCSVINFDEDGIKRALEPTLFFMPYCPVNLYKNLLQANWNPELLSKVVIFGNSFHGYKEKLAPNYLWPIMAANRFTNEFKIQSRNPCVSFIDDLSWTFFNFELQFMNNLPYDGCCRGRRKIDFKVYSWKEERLKEKIQCYMNNLESSQFYHNLQGRLQTSLVSQHLQTVMKGSKSKMKMVICDVGSFDVTKVSRLQLSHAILMKKHLKWIGEIQVFDQFLSRNECRVLKAFGCTVLSFNEYRRSWQALKPTMFFTPYTMLYNHLLEANWKSNLLSNIVLYGNSMHNGYVDEKKYSYMNLEYSMRYNEAVRSFTKEFRFRTFPHSAFHDLTWLTL